MLLSSIFAATAARRRASSACRSASVNFGAGGVTFITRGAAAAIAGEEAIIKANSDNKAKSRFILEPQFLNLSTRYFQNSRPRIHAICKDRAAAFVHPESLHESHRHRRDWMRY